MTAKLVTLQVRSRQQWRAWLAKQHTSSPGVWLVFYKAHTGVKSIRYDDTVREASLLRMDRQSYQTSR